jgi:hypothetical protein
MDNIPDWSAYGYVIEEELGNYYYEDRAIYRARDRHNRLVVLKEYRFFCSEAAVMPLVQQELDTLQTLAHPAIPRCLDRFVVRDSSSGEVGSIILVVEHKPGSSPEKGFHLNLEQLHHLTLQLLAILDYAQTLDPPVFHHSLNLGDIVVDYLPQGQIAVAVLNFGKARENVVMPAPEGKWQHDLQTVGVMLLRLLSQQATDEWGTFQQYFSSVNRLLNPAFLHSVQRLLADGEARPFTDAAQAYQQFLNTPAMVLAPALRHLPYPALLGYFFLTLLLGAVWFAWAQISTAIHHFSTAIAQFPMTISIGFTPEQQTEVNAVYLLVGGLFALGLLLGVVCAFLLSLEGVMVGIVLILLAALVLGIYWLAGVMLYWVIILAPIAITAILLLSWYRFLLGCYKQMQRRHFTVLYTLLTMGLGMLVAIALMGGVVSVLIGQRHVNVFGGLTLTALPLWLYLLTYPANRYKTDMVQHQRSQALVLKG